MRNLAIVLGVLIVLIQYPLWLGKGGWLKVWEADRQVSVQTDQNDAMQTRNDALAAEVSDLKQGMEAVEERARYDLGFVKKDEVYFQVIEPPKVEQANAP